MMNINKNMGFGLLLDYSYDLDFIFAFKEFILRREKEI